MNSPLCHTRHRMISLTTTGQDIAGFCVPANHKHFVPLYHSTGKPPKLVSRVSLLSVFTGHSGDLLRGAPLDPKRASNRNNPLQYTAQRIRKCCTVPPIAARRTAMCLHYKAAINSLLEHKTVKHHKHPEHIWPDLRKGLSPRTHALPDHPNIVCTAGNWSTDSVPVTYNTR